MQTNAILYALIGALGLMGLAGGLLLRSALSQARRRGEALQAALKSLEARIDAIPRSPSVDADAGEAKRRAGDQERALELRKTLDEGLKSGFTSVSSLVEKTSASMVSLSATVENSLSAQLDQTSAAISALGSDVRKTLQEETRSAASDRQTQLQTLAAATRELVEGAKAQWQSGSEALAQSGQESARAVENLRAEASQGLRAAAGQAEKWLGELAEAGRRLPELLDGAQRFGEASALHQAELKAAVEMLNQGLGGILDRLQSHAALIEGQEATVAKMETALRGFEERAVELLEENALKAQEALLEVLERLDVGRSPEADMVRAGEKAEPNAG